ncbi:hypothetical protein ABPG75_011412 [Micractinium tetrahymenae]
MAVPFRLELFSKSKDDLHKRILPFITQHQLWRINLPNKAKGELPALLKHVRALRAVVPAGADSNVCLHYSIAQNYARSADASFAALEEFACQLGAELQQQHVHSSSLSLLLVSGSQRRQLDSTAALERLAASPRFRGLTPPLPLAVAFNPYFPDEARQQEERRRLRLKLRAGRGLVTAVYLQAGSDAERLDQGLHFLQQLLDELAAPAPEQAAAQQAASVQQDRPAEQAALTEQQQQQQQQEARPAKRARQQPAQQPCGPGARAQQAAGPAAADAAGRPAVFGSLLLPSKKLLAQMRFRPWAGVFLSDAYLGSVEAAEAATLRVLRVYRRHGVVPLVETEVAGEAELARLQQLLAAAAEEGYG